MLEDKGVDVGVLLDALGDGLARAVAGPGLHPDEDGVGAAISGLRPANGGGLQGGGSGSLNRLMAHPPVGGLTADG